MKKRNLILLACFLSGFLCASSGRADIQYAGVSLSGAEFGQNNLPGTFNTDYTWPTSAELTYFHSKGMNLIRLPFRWERLQHTNNATLDATELGRMNSFVTNATAQGMYVLLDPHNYMRYYPSPRSSFQNATIGVVGDYSGSTVSNAAFGNFWSQLATLYKTNDHVFFGLMNEPCNVQEARLVVSENAAIAAIRATGATNKIFVPGNRWTGAWSWSNSDSYGAANATAMLGITDPASNFVYEVHQYLDSDSSGNTTNIVNVDIGWQRLTNFTVWARANNVKGFLGEFAVGNATITNGIGGQALTNMLNYMQTNSDVWVGWAWWGAGPWWNGGPGNPNATPPYIFLLDPVKLGQANQTDQPAMGILKHYFPLPVTRLSLIDSNAFQFTAPPGFKFQPEFSTDLTDSNSWTSYGPGFTNTSTPVVNMSVGSSPQGYYRIKATHLP